jgi:hypothetical protein
LMVAFEVNTRRSMAIFDDVQLGSDQCIKNGC